VSNNSEIDTFSVKFGKTTRNICWAISITFVSSLQIAGSL